MKQEGILTIALFLMEVIEECKGRMKINGKGFDIQDYKVSYGKSLSRIILHTKIKNIEFSINVADEKYIVDNFNSIAFVDNRNKLITFQL